MYTMTSRTDNRAEDPAKKAYIEGLKRYRDGELKEACGFFTTAITGGITDFDILYYRGMCHLDAGRYSEALTDFEVLIRQHPDNTEYIFRRGFIRYKTGDVTGAISDLILIPPDHPDFSIRWHYLSVLYYKAGDYNAALEAIEKALSLFPTMPKIWFNAGIIMQAGGLSDRAGLAFTTAARLEPKLASVRHEILE
ncbi:MAG TPA: tetratricopeptide repeat protein [Methanospirillum sp.]|jgi:tetratricopeptide (TPR) repeat protein|nr:tetratricopeptide repeat protein [Methanospirillum sp.]